MQKIKILGIAPYQSLKNTMTHIACNYENIELVTYVGNLEAGVQIVKQHLEENFDIIISRGGTAELIKSFSPIPVVEIPLSVYDILRAVKLLETSSSAYAVIGFPSITMSAHLLCDLLHYDMEIITIHQEAEAAPALSQLKENGYSFVLCDVISETLARQAGMNPILIVSGTESIENAFEQAAQICSCSLSLKQRCSILEDALKNQAADTIILKDDGSVFLSTYNAENVSIVLDYLKTLIQKPQSMSASKAFHLIDNTLYSLSVKYTVCDDSEFYLFCIEPNPVPAGSSKYGLRFASYTDMANMYSNSFYALTSSPAILKKQIEQFNQSSLPIMILGERGTGKNEIAAKLYLESPQKDNPYIIIDCQLINDRSWNFITQHYNSPFCDRGNTIFISNIQALSNIRCQQLLSILLDTNAHKRNRILVSCSQTRNDVSTDPSRNFIDYLPCTTIYMPPLRELADDIPIAANLYLNTLNIEFSKQVAGFEPETISLLRRYPWPDNIMQLKRVLSELVRMTTSPYIQAETVAKILEKETQQYVPCASTAFDYQRSLDEMIHDIVKVVVSQCDGNQTRAAKSLGIGRTTLWRYLNFENS